MPIQITKIGGRCEVLDVSLSSEMQDLRQELDDHLTAINENTDEIEMNFSYLINIEKKVKHLENKMDRIMDMLSKLMPEWEQKTAKKQIDINDKEESEFSILYGSPKAVDCAQIGSRLRRSDTFVRYSINSLMAKGIPISKHIISGKTYFALDPEFKELQCKENILNLSKTLTLDCFDQSIIWVFNI